VAAVVVGTGTVARVDIVVVAAADAAVAAAVAVVGLMAAP
jgi:hypothetical protein